jgi:hypothetical protein
MMKNARDALCLVGALLGFRRGLKPLQAAQPATQPAVAFRLKKRQKNVVMQPGHATLP